MIELPEALTLAKQMQQAVVGKQIACVNPPTKPHKFCWFCGEAEQYDGQMRGCTIAGAKGFGGFVELSLNNGGKLLINDGVNPRLIDAAAAPKDYQLLIEFTDGAALIMTVAMYGGIMLHGEDFDNPYYFASRGAVSPFAPALDAAYDDTFARCKPTISAKAFLATEQRFPGIGNGVTQDILLRAGINPKQKLHLLDASARRDLKDSMIAVLKAMIDQGGRDTEKDLYGNAGGYATQMSKMTYDKGCPVCGGPITKEAYLGGSVYYCPNCQPLIKA